MAVSTGLDHSSQFRGRNCGNDAIVGTGRVFTCLDLEIFHYQLLLENIYQDHEGGRCVNVPSNRMFVGSYQERLYSKTSRSQLFRNL